MLTDKTQDFISMIYENKPEHAIPSLKKISEQLSALKKFLKENEEYPGAYSGMKDQLHLLDTPLKKLNSHFNNERPLDSEALYIYTFYLSRHIEILYVCQNKILQKLCLL